MEFRINLNILVVSSLIIQLVSANWGTPGSSSQYHIQTDEGPERFFRYQTDNGQFRKERRLHDGTVIGTNAWIDGFGYLRQSDYIADHAGYRILKSKTVFVGKDSKIEDAMKNAKKVPTASGVLVPHSPSPPRTAYIPASVSTTTQRPYVSSTPSSFYHANTPKVFIKHHSHPNDLTSNGIDLQVSTASPIENSTPTLIFLPPHEDTSNLPPIAILSSSTPRTHIDESNLPPVAFYPSSTERPNIVKDESHLPPIAYYPPSNSLDSNSVIPLASTPSSISVKQIHDGLQPPSEYGVVPILPKSSKVAYRPGYKYPEYTRNDIPLYDRNKFYDGVSVTNNGFRYFLPRQYQEEQSHNDGTRDGSFGYIDPFGIRRVVYYNAGRNGFIHRKNNRYVGFNSTPYDPPRAN